MHHKVSLECVGLRNFMKLLWNQWISLVVVRVCFLLFAVELELLIGVDVLRGSMLICRGYSKGCFEPNESWGSYHLSCQKPSAGRVFIFDFLQISSCIIIGIIATLNATLFVVFLKVLFINCLLFWFQKYRTARFKPESSGGMCMSLCNNSII